jgi:hypothetical protein
LHCSDQHGIIYDPIAQPWFQFARARDLTGKDKICVWQGDNKVALEDEKYQQMEKLAEVYNPVYKVKPDFTGGSSTRTTARRSPAGTFSRPGPPACAPTRSYSKMEE